MIQFAHINIITGNWRKLADFYISVFDCIPLYPERDLKGKWLDKATNMDDAHLQGIHLALPGSNNNLPTLEIFQYSNNIDHPLSIINRKGLGHIAFKVDNVQEVVQKLIDAGGNLYGDIVETEIPNVGHLKFVYTRDPEGNIIEIQTWSNIN